MADLLKWGRDRKKNLSQAYDQINPLDNGLSWKTREVNAPHKSAATQGKKILKEQLVDPAVNTAQKAYNTREAARMGVGGLANVAYHSVAGTDQSYKQAIVRANQSIDRKLVAGAGNKGAYLTPKQAASGGDGMAGFKQNMVNPTLQATGEIAPWVLPIGALGMGGRLGTRVLAQAGGNAAVNAASDVAIQQATTGNVNWQQTAQMAGIGGIAGAAFPLAGAGIRGAVNAARRTPTAALDMDTTPRYTPEQEALLPPEVVAAEAARIAQAAQNKTNAINAAHQQKMAESQAAQAAKLKEVTYTAPKPKPKPDYKERAAQAAERKETVDAVMGEAGLIRRQVAMGKEIDANDQKILQAADEIEAGKDAIAVSKSMNRHLKKEYKPKMADARKVLNQLEKNTPAPKKTPAEMKIVHKELEAKAKAYRADMDAKLKERAALRKQGYDLSDPLVDKKVSFHKIEKGKTVGLEDREYTVKATVKTEGSTKYLLVDDEGKELWTTRNGIDPREPAVKPDYESIAKNQDEANSFMQQMVKKYQDKKDGTNSIQDLMTPDEKATMNRLNKVAKTDDEILAGDPHEWPDEYNGRDPRTPDEVATTNRPKKSGKAAGTKTDDEILATHPHEWTDEYNGKDPRVEEKPAIKPAEFDVDTFKKTGEVKINNGNSHAWVKKITVAADGKMRDAIELVAITSTKPKTGSATALMNDIKKFSTEQKLPIVLTAVATPKSAYRGMANTPEAPMNQKALEAWYEKQGFRSMGNGQYAWSAKMKPAEAPAKTKVYRGSNDVNTQNASPDRPVFYADTPEYASTYGKVSEHEVTGNTVTIDRANAYGDVNHKLSNHIKSDPEYKTLNGKQRDAADYYAASLNGEQLSELMKKPMPEIVKRAYAAAGIDNIKIEGNQFRGTVGKVGHQTEIIALPKPKTAEAVNPAPLSKADTSVKDITKIDYNSKPKPGTIRLYTNTKSENVDGIIKDGLLVSKSAQKEYSGQMTWFETTPNLKGHGGNTIAVDVPAGLRMEKVNDTQYTVFDDITPDNIVFVDRPVFDDFRTSDLKDLVSKYGKDKVREVYDQTKNKEVSKAELDTLLKQLPDAPVKAPDTRIVPETIKREPVKEKKRIVYKVIMEGGPAENPKFGYSKDYTYVASSYKEAKAWGEKLAKETGKQPASIQRIQTRMLYNGTNSQGAMRAADFRKTDDGLSEALINTKKSKIMSEEQLPIKRADVPELPNKYRFETDQDGVVRVKHPNGAIMELDDYLKTHGTLHKDLVDVQKKLDVVRAKWDDLYPDLNKRMPAADKKALQAKLEKLHEEQRALWNKEADLQKADDGIAPPEPPKPPAAKPASAPEPEDMGLDEITYSTQATKKGAKESFDDLMKATRTNLFNRYAPIEDFVANKDLRPSQNPATLLKRLSGHVGIANERLEFELKPIIQKTKNFEDLRKFLIAERSNELAARGMSKKANKALKELRAKVGDEEYANFQNIAKELYEYQGKFLKELHDMDGLSDEAYQAITMSNQKYIPFNRVLDGLEEQGFLQRASDVNVKSNGIKRIKGSERDIIDPIESMIKNTYTMTRLMEQQRSLQALRDAGLASGEFKKIKPKFVPVATTEHRAEVNAEFIQKIGSFAKDLGMKGWETGGKIKKSRNGGATMAYYTPATQRVTRYFGTSAKTMAHETGHFFDHKYGLRKRFESRGISKDVGIEMTKMMQKIGQNDSRTGSVAERFAHSFEYWMYHRNEATKAMPKFSRQMEQILEDIPELRPLKKMVVGNRANMETMDEVIFGPSQFDPKEPHFTVLENGKKTHYAVDKDIADAISGINEEQMHIAFRAMAIPASWVRATATTYQVGFAVPNVVRDQFSATVNSKYGGIPMVDFARGIASVLKKDDVFKSWEKSGADQSGFFSQERTTLQKGVRDITGEKKLAYKLGQYAKSPLELARIIGEFSEKGTRVGIYKRAIKGAEKAHGDDWTAFDKQLDAMVESREAAVDFSRRGAMTKEMNAIIPFLNARTQGTLKFIQSVRKRPVQTMLYGTAIAGVPAAVLYAHNMRYEEKYDEIPDYIKKNNFIIMTDDEKVPFIKVPKGEIGRIFGNPVEAFLDFARKKDGQNVAQLAAEIASALSPITSIGDVAPTAIKVPGEIITNYDTFRGRNIVSHFQQNDPAEIQTNKETSETFKAIGKGSAKLGLDKIYDPLASPAKLEHAFRGVTTGVGKQVLQITDTVAFRSPPDGTDLPIVDRFLGEPKDLSKTAQTVYEDSAKADRERARENYEIKQRLKNGDASATLGLPKQRAAALEKAVEEEKIRETLTPRQKALWNATNEQLDALGVKDPSRSADIELVRRLKYEGDGTVSAPKTNKSTVKPGSYEEKLKIDEFSSSKKKTTTIGETFYYKDKNGTTKSRPKYVQDYNVKTSKADLEMDRSKASGNVQQWYSAAMTKAEAISKYIEELDPDTDQDAINTKQKQLESLRREFQKYQSNGNSFTKATTSRSGSTRTVNGRRVWQAPKTGLNTFSAIKRSAGIRTILRNAKVKARKV